MKQLINLKKIEEYLDQYKWQPIFFLCKPDSLPIFYSIWTCSRHLGSKIWFIIHKM